MVGSDEDIVLRIDKDKATQQAKVNTPQDVTFNHIYADPSTHIYFYFLDKYIDQIQLPPVIAVNILSEESANAFRGALKNVLQSEFLGLQNIDDQITQTFTSKLLRNKILTRDEEIESLKPCYMLFNSGYNTDFLSIRQINIFITKWENIRDEEFYARLTAVGIVNKHRDFLTYKNSLVKAYKEFLIKAETHLADLKKNHT